MEDSIIISINGRNQQFICDDNKKDYITNIASEIETEMQMISNGNKNIADVCLLTIVAISYKDKIKSLEKQLEELQKTATTQQQKQQQKDEELLLDSILNSAKRIDALAKKLEKT